MIPALIAAAIAGVTALVTANKQNKAQKGIANSQNEANRRLQQEQNEYNTPANQMRRYQEAGLNKHLIYGQGTPGNQSSFTPTVGYNTADLSKLSDIVPIFNQTRLANSQVQAQNANTMQKNALAELNRMQVKVLEKNPLLDDAGFKATIDGLKAAAMLKAQQVTGQELHNDILDKSGGHMVNKVFQEVKLLEQRFNLGETDLKIKAEILKSKEFNNAILEVQKKFMTDGDITPQHILQFIQLILMKAL